MSKQNIWWYFPDKPLLNTGSLCWNKTGDKFPSMLSGFDIDPVDDWTKSLREVGCKTDHKIELEKKLEIVIKDLKEYAFNDFEAEEIENDELSPNYGVPVIKSFPYAINQELAQQALKEIKG